MEIVSNIANTESGYQNLTSTFNNWENQKTFPNGSGETLYSSIVVEESPGLIRHGVNYKKVTISVFTDSTRISNHMKSEYTAAFNNWW